MNKGVLKRIFKLLFADYRPQLITVMICIVLSAIGSTVSSIFMTTLIGHIERGVELGWSAVKADILTLIAIMCTIYVIGIIASFVYTRLMAIVTQSFLNTTRQRMFAGMQKLPIKYFDTNHHGDTMSRYTNDIDTLRELVSRCIPQLISSSLIVTILVVNMLYLSLWLTLVIFLGVIAMIIVTKKIGGNSAKYFIKQQKSIGKAEGFIEEMMNGQKVIKVFCHEEQSGKDFDAVNEQLCKDATEANRFANILMPIMGNIGNILYVLQLLF